MQHHRLSRTIGFSCRFVCTVAVQDEGPLQLLLGETAAEERLRVGGICLLGKLPPRQDSGGN